MSKSSSPRPSLFERLQAGLDEGIRFARGDMDLRTTEVQHPRADEPKLSKKESPPLADEERRLVQLRLQVSQRIRELRKQSRLTQRQLAVKLGSSQPRIAKIEAGDVDVSLDQMMKGLFAVGGDLADLAATAAQGPQKGKKRR